MPRVIDYDEIQDFEEEDYLLVDNEDLGTRKIKGDKFYKDKMNKVNNPIGDTIGGYLVETKSDGNLQQISLKKENISELANNYIPEGYTLKGNEVICFNANGKIIIFVDPDNERPLLVSDLLKKPSSYTSGNLAMFNENGQLIPTAVKFDSYEETENKVHANKGWATNRDSQTMYPALNLLKNLEFLREWDGTTTHTHDGKTYQLLILKTDLNNRNPFSVLYFKNKEDEYEFMKCKEYEEVTSSGVAYYYIMLEEFGGGGSGDVPSTRKIAQNVDLSTDHNNDDVLIACLRYPISIANPQKGSLSYSDITLNSLKFKYGNNQNDWKTFAFLDDIPKQGTIPIVYNTSAGAFNALDDYTLFYYDNDDLYLKLSDVPDDAEDWTEYTNNYDIYYCKENVDSLIQEAVDGKEDKWIIRTSASAGYAGSLVHNVYYKLNQISYFSATGPNIIPENFRARVSFSIGSSIVNINLSNIKLTGDDVENGILKVKTNKRYTIDFWFDGKITDGTVDWGGIKGLVSGFDL